MKQPGSTSAYADCLQQFCQSVLTQDIAVAPYRNNYLGGHARALEAVYPGVRQHLGANAFAALARVYTQHYPAPHWDLNLYGERFDELLQAQTLGARADKSPWWLLACLARQEYAATQAYYADERQA